MPEKTVRTLTLRKMPEDLYARLKASAAKNRRSLNSEILVHLQRDLAAPTIDAGAYVKELKAFTTHQPKVEHATVTRYKRRGRD